MVPNHGVEVHAPQTVERRSTAAQAPGAIQGLLMHAMDGDAAPELESESPVELENTGEE